MKCRGRQDCWLINDGFADHRSTMTDDDDDDMMLSPAGRTGDALCAFIYIVLYCSLGNLGSGAGSLIYVQKNRPTFK